MRKLLLSFQAKEVLSRSGSNPTGPKGRTGATFHSKSKDGSRGAVGASAIGLFGRGTAVADRICNPQGLQ